MDFLKDRYKALTFAMATAAILVAAASIYPPIDTLLDIATETFTDVLKVVFEGWVGGEKLAAQSRIALGFPLIGVFYKFFQSKKATFIEPVWPSYPAILDRELFSDLAEPILATAKGQPFVGRGEELDSLLSRARSGLGGVNIVCIHGPMGMGKTRLALEVLQTLRDEGWDAGRLRSRVSSIELDKFRPRRSTVILIDEYETANAFWDSLSALSRNGQRHDIYVLLTGFSRVFLPSRLGHEEKRRIEGALQPSIQLGDLDVETADKLRGEAAPSDSEGATHDGQRRPLFIKLGRKPWTEVRRRAGERLDRAEEIAPDTGPSLLAYSILTNGFEVLSTPIEVDIGADRMAEIFDGQARRYLKRTVRPPGPAVFDYEVLLQWIDKANDQQVDRLVGMALDCAEQAVHQLFRALWTEYHPRRSSDTEPDTEAARKRLSAYRRQSWADTDLAYGDQLLADLDVRFQTGRNDLAGTERTFSTLSGLCDFWSGDPRFIERYTACLLGATTHWETAKDAEATCEMALQRFDALAAAEDATTEVKLSCAKGWANAAAFYGTAAQAAAERGEVPDWTLLNEALQRLDAFGSARNATTEVEFERAKGWMNATIAFGSVAQASGERGEMPDWTLLKSALQRLDALAGTKDATTEFKLKCAQGWRIATIVFGGVARVVGERGEFVDWTSLEAALQRLDALASAEDATAEINLECAKGWSNAATNYGNVTRAVADRGGVPDLTMVKAALQRLEALAAGGDATTEIKTECAMGWMNATGYGKVTWGAREQRQVPDRALVKVALQRLDALADAEDATTEMKLLCAQGWMNALVEYGSLAMMAAERGKMHDWTQLKAALQRLDALADAEGATVGIKLLGAKGWVNATSYYGSLARAAAERGEVPDWTLLEEALQRLDALAGAQDATTEIKLLGAKGWVNATIYFGSVARAAGERGEVPDWTQMKAALQRLDALAVAEDATSEIRLACAKGWTNGTSYYSSVAKTVDEGYKAKYVPDLKDSYDFIERSLSWYQTVETGSEIFKICANLDIFAAHLNDSSTRSKVRFLIARLALQPELHYAPVQHEIFRSFPHLSFHEQEARGFSVAGHPPKAKQPPASLEVASHEPVLGDANRSYT